MAAVPAHISHEVGAGIVSRRARSGSPRSVHNTIKTTITADRSRSIPRIVTAITESGVALLLVIMRLAIGRDNSVNIVFFLFSLRVGCGACGGGTVFRGTQAQNGVGEVGLPL